MSRRVDARDVLDANAITRRAFRGRVIGHWRRTGPNAWDDYAYVASDGGVVDILPDVHVQIERFGAQLRTRVDGRVVRVRVEDEALGRDDGERRERLLGELVERLDGDGRVGAAAVIASKLER